MSSFRLKLDDLALVIRYGRFCDQVRNHVSRILDATDLYQVTGLKQTTKVERIGALIRHFGIGLVGYFDIFLALKMSSPQTSRPLPTEGPSAGGDEFDDLFDYEVGGDDDPFSENYKVPDKAPAAKETITKGKSGTGLGIDEEVEVARKPRAPRVKLDEHRYTFFYYFF